MSSVFARTACDVDLQPTKRTYWTRGVMHKVLVVVYRRPPRRPPFACCDCDHGECVVCPYSVRCTGCGAGVAQRCRRPSGHQGPMILPHEVRYLETDVVAIERDPDEVASRARAVGASGDRELIAAWVRNLTRLHSRLDQFAGRVHPDQVWWYVALAQQGPGAIVQQQLPLQEGVDGSCTPSNRSSSHAPS